MSGKPVSSRKGKAALHDQQAEAQSKDSITVERNSPSIQESADDDSYQQELEALRVQLDQERRERQAIEDRLRHLEQVSTVPSIEQEPTVVLDQSVRPQLQSRATAAPSSDPVVRGVSQPSNISVLSRIEKIPKLPTRLSDGITYRPRLWQQQILNHLDWYSRYFLNDEHRKSYILDNTEGMARDFLEPLFLDPDGNSDPYDLIDSVCKFLTNPAEKSQARTKFKKLEMEADNTFWEFYHEFRTTATLAGFRDDLTLRTELRDKLLPRLRMKLTQEWRRCDNLTEWVAAIQEEDAAWVAERTLHGGPASDKSTTRSGIYAGSRTAYNNLPVPKPPVVPRVSFDTSARDTTSHNAPKNRPNTPWRNDTPRQQTPLPARYSNVPPTRQSTPHVSEIAMDNTLEESYEDAVEHLAADELEGASCPRAKDDA